MLVLTTLWIIWCILHSLLISRPAHEAVQRALPGHAGKYRLFYVLFSILSLVPVLWYHFSLPTQVILPGNLWIWGIQVLLLVYAATMFWAGARMYDLSYFLGLSQLGQEGGQEDKQFTLYTGGILAHVRHPWYSGGIAFLWGIGPVTDVFLLTRSILTVYIVTGTLLEESRLRKELGEEYRDYSRKVPMLFPWRLFAAIIKPNRPAEPD